MKAQLQPKFGRKTGSGDSMESVSESAVQHGDIAVAVRPAELANDLPPPPPIALDLAPALRTAMTHDGERHDQIVIKVESLAQSAVLSAGRNNGDRTWSLGPNEIDGLTYTLSTGPLMPHTLQVRVIGVSDDQATTLVLLETDIGTDATASPLRLFNESPGAPTTTGQGGGDDFDGMAGLSKAIGQSRQLARARIAAAKAASEADELDQVASVAPDELVILRARMHELEAKLKEGESAFAEARDAWEAERHALTANAAADNATDIQAQIDMARDSAAREARKTAAHEMAQREKEAAAAWTREKELLQAEAKVRIETAHENADADKVRTELESMFEVERKALQAAAERQLSEARAAFEAETKALQETADARLTEREAAFEVERRTQQTEADRRVDEACATFEADREAQQKDAERRLADAAVAVRTETESTLKAARAEWREEAQTLRAEADDRVGIAVAKATDAARHEAEARIETVRNEAQIRQDEAIARTATERDALEAELARVRATIASEVEHARTSWEIETAQLRTELDARVEAARREGEANGRDAGKAEAIAAASESDSGMLAAARAEWEDELARTVARVREEAAEQAKSAQAGTIGAAVEAARTEWRAERQTLAETHEARLVELQRESDTLRAELTEARDAWQEEKSALLADADARIAAAGTDDPDQASAEAARRDAAVKEAVTRAETRWRRELDFQADAAEKRIAAMRVSAETELEAAREKAVKASLAEARTKWETEAERRLSDAEAKWQSESAERLAAAEKSIVEEHAERIEDLETHLATAQSQASAALAAPAASAKRSATDPKLAAAISRWNRTHKKRRKLPLPHFSRRLALGAICIALLAAGGLFYNNGIDLYRKYAPVVDAKVGPRADEVASQAREIAALVEAVIRERFPNGITAGESDSKTGTPAEAEDPLDAMLRHAWVRPDAANMRAEPTSASAIVATLAQGAEVEQLTARGAWIKVRAIGAKNRQGWVHASLLSSRMPDAAQR